MKDKFKYMTKRAKRIISKIVKDKELLTIFIIAFLVIILGIIVIGFFKTFIILLGLFIIGYVTILIMNKKNQKNIQTKKKIKRDKNALEEKKEDKIKIIKNTKKETKKDIENEENEIFKEDSDEVMSKKIKKKKTKIDEKKKKKIFSKIITIILILMLLGILAVFAFIGYIVISAPEFNPTNLYRKESSIVYDNNGEVIAKLGTEIRKTITYDEMPEVLVDAIIATEDSRFFQHNGVDLPRFTKAVIGQLMGNSGAGGGSTITMQISKNAYTTSISTGIEGIIRKFTDIYLSVFKIEKKYSKKQILEYYVNIPGLGSNSFGVAEASETYFGKNVSELNLSEAALIAGLFQAPTAYNPYLHPEAAEARRAVVLRLMRRHGYITEEEEEMANAISVESLLGVKSYSSPYQNFIDVVVDEILEKTGESPYNTPMKIYTTMDKAKQDHLNSIVNGGKYTWVNDNVQVGIAVTDVENGGILALSGGRNTVAMGLNRATDLKKHPGSTAKPIFDYGPGVEYNNWSTYTPFIDEPWSYSNGGQIKNWDDGFYGFLSLKRALGLSRNIPALKAFQNVQNKKIKEFATSLGIKPELEDGYVHEAHALGAFDGVSPLQMAVAYSSFANGGYHIDPYTITKIVYLDSNQTKEFKPTKVKVMSDASAYIITNSLIWAVDSGVSSGSKIAGRQVASKTGTSNFDYQTLNAYKLPYSAVKDYWVVGYTPKISIGLWYGYDKITDGYNTLADNSRKDKVFNLVMRGMVDDSPKNFTIPKSVVAVEVENGTVPAMLPSENTPKNMITTEYFKSGTEPTEISPRYMQLNNPTGLNVEVENGIANISWNAVNIPYYYTESWMNEHIKDGIGDKKENYIKYRNQEIEKLGEFGYDIYLVNNGNEKYIKTTTETNTSIDIKQYTGEIKIIVKTTWANDKATTSSGSEYSIKEEEPLSIVNVVLKGNPNIELKLNDKYNEESVTVLDNFVDVTNDAEITRTITNSNNEMYSEIDTSVQDTYTIKYKIVYKNTTYEKTRTVVIKNESEE